MSTETIDKPKNTSTKKTKTEHPHWQEAVRYWEPNPIWFHPLLTTAWVWIVGSVLHYARVPSPFSGIAAVGIMAASWLALIQASKADDDPETMTIEERYGSEYLALLKRFTAFVGVVACVWLAWSVNYSPVNPMSWGTLLLGGVVCGAGYAVLVNKRPQYREAKIEEDRAKREEINAQQHARIVRRESSIWEPWLHKASKKLHNVHVIDVRETRAGYTLTLENNPEGGDQPATFADLRAALPTLVQFASSHFSKQDIPFGAHQLRAEESQDYGHIWYLYVSTKQPLRESIKYEHSREPSSILVPQKVGIYEDGEDFKIDLYSKHGAMVAGTGGGKSVFTNGNIAAITRCHDAMVWAVGIEKLVPLVFPWLVPWLRGDTSEPVLDWVAGEDPVEAAKLLADAYAYVKIQNKRLGARDKHEPTPDDPAIVLIIDEATQLLRRNDLTITTFDGKTWTPASLVSALAALARSSGLSLWFMTQVGLMDGLGTAGNEIYRNVTLRVVGKTFTAIDGRQTLVGMDYVDTTKLRDYTLLAQPDTGVPRAIPAKAFELYGLERISPVAYAHTRWKPKMRPDIAAQLQYYADRWSAERQPDLVAAAEAEGYTWPEPVNSNHLPDNDSGVTLREGDNSKQEPVVRNTREELVALEAKWREAAERAKEKAAKYGALGREVSLAVAAIRRYEVPDGWWPATDLAAAAATCEPDSTEPVDAERLAETLQNAPFNVPVTEHSGHVGFLADDIRRCVLAYLKDSEVPQQRSPQAQAVLDALEAFEDDWVPVGELGRRAGLIGEGSDLRAEAASFSALLRSEFRLPEDAFKRTNRGSVVSVAALKGLPV